MFKESMSWARAVEYGDDALLNGNQFVLDVALTAEVVLLCKEGTERINARKLIGLGVLEDTQMRKMSA
jgi:hypothetical protein